ncbi:MAG: M56 family metallopeptidase, partial [Planctomycetota bacterium]
LWLSSAWLVLLIDVSVKALLLAALAGAVLLVLRVRNTNVQHRVWAAVLVGMLVLPLLVPVTPSVRVPARLLPAFGLNQAGEAAALPITDSASARSEIDGPGQAGLEATQVSPGSFAQKTPLTGELPYAGASTGPSPDEFVQHDANQAAVAAARLGPERGRGVWPVVVLAVYTAVFAVFVFRFLIGILGTIRLAHRARPISPESLGVSASDAGSLTRVAILESPAIRLPLTLGWLRPKILLPAQWRTWSKAKCRSVLAHELAHVGRRDYLVTLLVEWNRCLYWFHPLAWHLPSRLSRLAEQSCDDAAVVSTGDRAQYARCLLELAGDLVGRRGRLFQTAGIPMARRANVERRIAAILDPKRPLARRVGRLAGAVLIALVAPAVLLAAALRPASEHAPDEAKETAQAGAEPEVASETSPPSVTREDAPGGDESEFRGPVLEPGLTSLVQQLEDEDLWVRLRAVQAIGGRNPTDTEPVPALIKAMNDESGRVRVAAARALLRIGPVNEQVVLAFIRASRDNWKGVIQATDDFFHLVGSEHNDLVPELTEMLKDPKARVRICAVTALGNMGPKAKSAVPALVDAMKDDETLCLAEDALEKMGPAAKAAVPGLTEILGGTDLGASHCAARVLAAIGPDAREAVPALIACLQRRNDPWGQLSLCTSLATLDPKSSQAIEALTRLADGPCRDIQPAAHFHLVKMGETGASHFQALIDALEDSNPRVRLTAAAYLGRLGKDASEATPSLLAALDDVDPEARVEAAHAILLVCPKGAERKRAADVVLEAVDDKVFMAQVRAFSALEAFGPEESWSTPLLTTLATSTSIPQPRFRLAAINALGNIGSAATESIPALVALLEDDHWEIRQNARDAITRIVRQPGNARGDR